MFTNIMNTMNLRDPAVFERAYDDHHRSVYAAAFRVLGDGAQAQDVVQDVFLKLWRRPETFDARRGELGGYLRMMARSRALDLWREGQASGRAQDRLKIVVAGEEPSIDARPGALAERGEDRDTIRGALSRLPLAQREALVLAYFGGLSADEISRHIHIPLGTAKSRVRLGLEKLRAECEAALSAAA
jgi:RNA polymerase sigma-70 factor (ECF subfamily)